jgi:hypothetical protein
MARDEMTHDVIGVNDPNPLDPLGKKCDPRLETTRLTHDV